MQQQPGDKNKPAPVGVANVERRTWDEAAYEEKAAQRDEQDAIAADESKADARKRRRMERDPLHQGLIVERAKLKARDHDVDLTSRLGKAQAVSSSAHKSAQGGWYCSVCDCVLKDSKAWLDHINGKYHNAALGMSMRVEKSSKDEVREKLEALAREKEEARARKKREQEKRKAMAANGASDYYDDDDEDESNNNKREKKAGGGPLPSSSSFDPEDAFARRVAEREAAEAREKEAKRAALAAARKKLSRGGGGGGGGDAKKKEEEEEDDGEADAMAAAMGFKSFGGG